MDDMVIGDYYPRFSPIKTRAQLEIIVRWVVGADFDYGVYRPVIDFAGGRDYRALRLEKIDDKFGAA